MGDTTHAKDLSWWRAHGRWRLVGLVLLLVALPVVRYLVGRRAETEAESVANASPPPILPVTASVEVGTIDDSVVVRGTVVQDSVDLFLGLDGSAVVTGGVPEEGASIEEGSVVLVLDDRPVFALGGALPLINDLAPRSKGSMVIQLQEALGRLGFYEGETDGIYGWSTQRAVRDMYRQAGFDPPEQEAAETPDGAAGAPASSGTPLVVSEIVFLPELPQTLGDVEEARGSVVDAETPVFSLPQGETVVESYLSTGEAAPFQVGMTVELRTDDDSITTTGVVVSLEPPDDPELGELVMVVELSGDEMSGRHGLPVQVATPGTEVPTGLVVPYTAVRSTGDRSTYVLKVASAGSERVNVEVVAEGDGFVRVDPVDGGLAEGDRVVVGGDG